MIEPIEIDGKLLWCASRWRMSIKKNDVGSWCCPGCGQAHGFDREAATRAMDCCWDRRTCDTEGCPNTPQGTRYRCGICEAREAARRWANQPQVDYTGQPIALLSGRILETANDVMDALQDGGFLVAGNCVPMFWNCDIEDFEKFDLKEHTDEHETTETDFSEINATVRQWLKENIKPMIDFDMFTAINPASIWSFFAWKQPPPAHVRVNGPDSSGANEES